MSCRLVELRHKEVINACDGTRIGYVDDLEIDTKCARVVSLVVFGRPRFFGIFGRSEDYIIPWDNINLIGEDTILVDFRVQKKVNKAKNRNKIVTFCH